MKKGDNIYLVDLENISFYSQETLNKISSNKDLYYKTPFLYLITSYLRNGAINWLDNNFKYIDKKQTGAWMVYKFQ